MRRRVILFSALTLALVGPVAACSGDGGGTAATTTTAASTGDATTTEASSSASTSASGTAKVSANTASVAEIQAALEQAGVSNASRWAREVEEYRPYPADDASLTKLKEELQKYNPGSDTLTKILSVLEP